MRGEESPWRCPHSEEPKLAPGDSEGAHPVALAALNEMMSAKEKRVEMILNRHNIEGNCN